MTKKDAPDTALTTQQTVIVQAALECLEQYGEDGLTVRQIAARAGVNVAAINYHFRSKEKLLEQVFDLASASAFLDIDDWVTAREGEALRSQLEAFLLHYANGSVEYPNVSRTLLLRLTNPDQAGGVITERLETFLQALTQRFAWLHGKNANNLEVRLQTLEFISVMISLCLMPDVFHRSLKIDVQQADTRAKLVASFVKGQLKAK